MTSTPTAAMLAAARGEAYHISFGGSCGFQYTDDIAKTLIQAAHTSIQGAEVFNIKGSVAHMAEVVAAIETAAPAAKGCITFEDAALVFPDGQDDAALQTLLGTVPYTPLAEGIAQTITHFKAAIADGRLPQTETQPS
jgi:nucleoside-diphosphate-sugar epimerase